LQSVELLLDFFYFGTDTFPLLKKKNINEYLMFEKCNDSEEW